MSAGFPSGQRVLPRLFSMTQLLLIGAGGAVGSIARYLLSGFVQRAITPYFPTGTFAVNVIGCFVVGFIGGIVATRPGFSPELRLLLIVGFCGGFTTFSAFSWETFELIGKDAMILAATNVIGQITAGLLAVWAGLAFARAI